MITPVVLVCSPLMVATAKGSGKPATCHQHPLSPPFLPVSRTENISLVQSISRNDCVSCQYTLQWHSVLAILRLLLDSLVTRRLGCEGSSMMTTNYRSAPPSARRRDYSTMHGGLARKTIARRRWRGSLAKGCRCRGCWWPAVEVFW